jgi:MGT family glycosyltransferase
MLWNPVRFFCFLIRKNFRIAAALVEEIADLKPECIVYDSLMAAGKIIAQHLGCKHVSSVTIPVFTGSGIRASLRPGVIGREFCRNFHHLVPAGISLLRLRRRFGVWLDPFTAVQNEAPLNIVYTSSFFQPGAEVLGKRFCFTGPSITDRQDAGDFPLAKLEGKKVVYIALGTILNDELTFYRNCIALLENSEYTVVLSIGKNIAASAFTPTPPNFIIHDHVPQLEILKKAGVFITHAGMNSVQEGLYFGIPLIILPRTPEQEFIADRVVEVGAGIQLHSPSELGTVAAQLDLFFRAGSLFKAQAEKIGRTLREAGGYRKAVAKIREYCGSE